jgi:predicted acyl esterase
MSRREVRIRMRDGVKLAATLYLPEVSRWPPSSASSTSEGGTPCLLEALPYRKDDLTSGSAPSYERLRDEFGFAVCRVDLRGTGSSNGDATDEYPAIEQQDLVEVISWLADQPWCNGNIGMFGTSYPGCNPLQLACERPPALKAVCAIYSTDDRWTDDVHFRGGALKWLDLVDYCHYMTPMTMLPPVPAVYGRGWRDEWIRRLETQEPWVLTWLRENRDGEYWRHGSVRRADGTGYERIEAAVMLVAGWADGYRNNSFRTIDALKAADVPHRLLAGPWAHADPATAMPGPRIDLDMEMAQWFDTWLRNEGAGHQDREDIFVRTSTRPAGDLDLHAGSWSSRARGHTEVRQLGGEGAHTLGVEPDVGTTAWIDCAGHLPWGQSGDQRADDARSLTWDWPTDELTVIGHPVGRLRVSATAPRASLSVKLCDVFPDGTSALVTRGTIDLRYRDGLHQPPQDLVPGEEYDVTIRMDACAYQFKDGQTLRLSIAGADWPNTVAPPAPLELTIHEGTLELPETTATPAEPGFTPGDEHSAEDLIGTDWTVTDDVLRRTTTCSARHSAEYDTPHGGYAREQYAGDVTVDRRTFAQRASARCTYRLTWPGIDIKVTSTMRVELKDDELEVHIDIDAFDKGYRVARRDWTERIQQ